MSDVRKWDEINGLSEPAQRMEAFLDSATDSYAILQLRNTPDTAYERYESMRGLARQGKEPDIDHYEVVYCGPLTLPMATPEAITATLEDLYVQFNYNRPMDFTGYSLSVSDIVALKVDDVVSSHYVDSIGFAELPDFIRRENYLKSAEMPVEDDYGMIDGVINNGRREPSAEERPSVLEQLKSYQTEEPDRDMPHRNTEREER